MKIVTILGSRPQFIKAGSLSRKTSKYKSIEEIIIHIKQHYNVNMSDIFFKEMKVPKPNYFLSIEGKSHGATTRQMIEKIEKVALKENLDLIVRYEDTNSTLARCQREMYFFNKQYITLRDEMEWSKLVDNGIHMIIDVKKEKILLTYNSLHSSFFNNLEENLYGDGKASEIPVNQLLKETNYA